MPHSLTVPPSTLQFQDDGTAFTLVFALAVFFVVNYFAGRFYNVAKGRKITSLAQNALSDLDPSPRLRWSGTKAIVLSGTTKNRPVSEYRLNLLLMGRENIVNWAIARVTGRTDMAIFLANLPKKPRAQFDAIRKNTPPHRALMRGEKGRLYTAADPPPYTERGDMVIRQLAGESREMESLVRLISEQPRIWTFSVRREEPTLVVNLTLQGISKGEARDVLQTILLVSDKINGLQ